MGVQGKVQCRQLSQPVQGRIDGQRICVDPRHLLDETFALVVKMTTIRVVLAVATSKGWHLHQMAIKNVFLQGDPEEQVYMVLPPGFWSELNKSAMCRLKKSLYGLKQAGLTCRLIIVHLQRSDKPDLHIVVC